MHDPGPVDRGQRGHRADREPVERVAGARPLGLHDPLQRDALDELAHDVGAVAVQVDAQDLGGAELRHPAGGGDLAEEAVPVESGGPQAGVEQLDRDHAPVGSPSRVDDALRSLAQSPDEPVGAQRLRIAATQRLRVRHVNLPSLAWSRRRLPEHLIRDNQANSGRSS
nr:hypothetical protein GCM10020093_081260 [Planobispora longispora]